MSSADTVAPPPATHAPAALATRQLVAGYGDVPVIRGVDLDVREGQLVAVVGPNGAGKSTLLKAILGLARVMGGQVLADGTEVTGRPLEELVRLGVGYVPQVDDVFDPLKVSENLNMGGYLLSKEERAARMDEVLAIFPALRSRLNRYVGTMSGGERKMTAIARALMLSPRVLILDEPTAGLSAALTEAVLNDQVRALADHGHAVLLVEQKAQAALRLADVASVLVQGTVAMSAPAAEVLASPQMAEVFLGGRPEQLAGGGGPAVAGEPGDPGESGITREAGAAREAGAREAAAREAGAREAGASPGQVAEQAKADGP
jgi:branched-chain amino acid transport system ATP-binding protein